MFVQCIPLGVAMALKKKKSDKIDSRDLTFSIMEVANLLHKPSGYIKRELKQLQWTQTAGNLSHVLFKLYLMASDELLLNISNTIFW